MIENCCEFKTITDNNVQCVHCKRWLSGPPERYAGKYVCKERGPGAEFARKLNAWAGRFGLEVKSCARCNWLKMEMNKHGTEWCKSNKATIVNFIQQNAKNQGLTIPKIAISTFLRSIGV